MRGGTIYTGGEEASLVYAQFFLHDLCFMPSAGYFSTIKIKPLTDC